MKMTGEEIIAAPRQVVWDALNDPEILKQSITGCEEIKKKSDTEFEARVTAKVGPVKASFMGNVKLSKLSAPRSYVISGEGKGGVAGFAKGGATVQLSDTADGQTKLSYDVDAQVGGKLAQIGSRLIDSSAKKMAADFFKKFNKIVSERAKDMAVEKVSKPAAKKAAAKKTSAKKTAAANASKASAKASKPAAKAESAATGKAAAKTAAAKAKPAVKSAKVAAKSTAGATKAAAKSAAKTAKAATKPAASKTSAAAKTAKSSARKAAKCASGAVEAAASQTASAADASASKAGDAASSVASAAKQPVSKASEAMPPQAQAMSRLWIWVVLAAVAGLVVVWATGGSGGQ